MGGTGRKGEVSQRALDSQLEFRIQLVGKEFIFPSWSYTEPCLIYYLLTRLKYRGEKPEPGSAASICFPEATGKWPW